MKTKIPIDPGMDPFQDYAVSLCNSFTNNTTHSFEFDKKWSLLACEMVLKEKSLDSSVNLRVLKFLLELVEKEKLTANNWIFVIDCARKGIKRLGSCDLIGQLINIISENIKVLAEDKDLVVTVHVLKLLLTCKDHHFEFNDKLRDYLNAFYSSQNHHFNVPLLDFDEFHFVDCAKSAQYKKQKCLRLLLLLDPLKGFAAFTDATDEYWFNLFSISDSELISFMKILLKADEKRFLKFYNRIITNNLLSVDFFIEQLLTDSVELLELLLDTLELQLDTLELKVSKKKKIDKDFRNFHTLLLLKLEMSSENFPFNCKILLKKLEIFIGKM